MRQRFLRALSTLGGRRGLTALALAAAAAGISLVVVAVTSQTSPPVPNRSAYGHITATPPPTPSGNGSSTADGTVPSKQPPTPSQSQPRTTKPLMITTRSRPTHIDIPAIDVSSAVFAIGKTPEGGLAVPQPGPNLNKAAWYAGSVTPGQPGPSVIEGHIDSIYGPSVFYRLGALKIGDTIRVTRADGQVTVFVVNAVRAYATHGDFPTETVYGGDLSQPTLRLITCAHFNESIRHYLGNEVVYAHLVGVHRR